MADGSINFDTKIDTSSFKAQIKAIESELKKLDKELASTEKERLVHLKFVVDNANEYEKMLAIYGSSNTYNTALRNNPKDATFIKQYQEALDSVIALEDKESEINAELDEKNAKLGEINSKINQSSDGLTKEQEILKYNNEQLAIFKGYFTNLASSVGGFFSKIGGKVKSLFSTATKGIKTLFSKIKSGGGNKGLANNIVKQFTRIGNLLKLRVLRSIVSAIANAVNQGIQALAKASPSFNSAISSMQSALSTLGANFVSAFSPIIEYVAPVLVTLINHLNSAVLAIGNFLSALTGKSTTMRAIKVQKDYAKSLDGTAKSASNAQKKLASFDEINQLNFTENSSGGGGSSGSSDIQYEEVKTQFSELADLINNGEFIQAGTYLADMINEQIAQIDWEGIGTNIGTNLQHAIEFAFGFITNIDTMQIGSGIATLLNSGFSQIDVYMLGQTLIEILNRIVDFSLGFTSTFDFSAFGYGLAQGINGIIQNFDIVSMINGLDGWVTGIWNSLVALLQNIDYAEFFHQIGLGLGTAIQNILEWEIWDTIGEYFEEKADECGGSMILGILKGIVDALIGIGQWIIDNIFTPIIDGVKEAFGIHSPSTVFQEIGEMLIEGMLEGLKETWSKITTWFTDNFGGIISWIKDVFNGDWESAWSGCLDVFKDIWNGIVSACESAINWIIDGLNSFSVTVPDWVPFAGGSTFGFSVGHVSLPKLASGTVVPPNNGEFLAMLGDNKNETEVVSPLSTMKQALSEVMAEYSQAQNVNINFGGSLSGLAKVLKPVIEQENKRVGTSLVTSGA